MLVVLSPIFVADTKITFVCNFVAPLNTFSDQIIICQISFGNLWRQTNLFSNEKVNIWTPSGYFPFLFHFSVEIKQPRNLQQKKTREKWEIVKPITLQLNFFEVTRNREVIIMQETFISMSLYEYLFLGCLCHQKSFIETIANLFENTYSRCGAGLQPGNSPVVSFSRIIRNTYFQEHLRVFFIFFFDRNISYSLCLYLFPQKNRRPVFFSSSVLLSIVIYKFTNRNSCGYCFRHFGKFPRERLQRSSLLGCRLRTLCFLTVSD